MKKILVLSGGGAKFALEVTILKELENRGELKNIDIIFGSSAGAIVGSILASGKMTSNDLYNCQSDVLKKVFKKSWNPFKIPKYDRKNFADIWLDKIGNIKMSDLKTKLVITSVDFVEKKTHFFKSWEDLNENVLGLVLRSFAAPYYFSLINDSVNEKVWGDGGMTNNNIAITPAILETINLDWDWETENIKFIIIGTGYVDVSETYNKVSKEGFISQILDYISPEDGGMARMISRQEQIGQLQFLCKKFKNLHFDYYDIQIPKSINKMDAVDKISDYINYGLIAAKTPLIVG